jgi:hypothetical protein
MRARNTASAPCLPLFLHLSTELDIRCRRSDGSVVAEDAMDALQRARQLYTMIPVDKVCACRGG